MNQKSKYVTALLGIILGRFGLHNFYLGYNKKGIIQVVISLLTLGIFFAITGKLMPTILEGINFKATTILILLWVINQSIIIWAVIESFYYVVSKKAVDSNGEHLR